MALLALTVVVAVALAALYLNRRAAAREVLVGWLDDRGIDAEVEVERVDIDGFVGRIRIGDPADPDFTVERAEVDYAVGLPWSSGGLGVTPRRIRLIRPVLKARWIDGKFSLGSLDPLVEEFTGRPPSADSRAPLVLVETGRLRLTTEYGPMEVLADARVEDNRLMRLTARMPTAALKSGDVEIGVESADLNMVTTGDRLVVRLNADLKRLSLPGLAADQAVIGLNGDLPYPDLKTRRSEGDLRLTSTMTAAQLRLGDIRTRDARTTIGFDGGISGWIDSFRLIGTTDTRIDAAGLEGGGLQATRISGRVDDGQFTLARTDRGTRWRLDSPATVRSATLTANGMTFGGLGLSSGRLLAGGRNAAYELSGPVALTSDRFAFGELTLAGLSGQLALDMVQDGGARVVADGALAARSGAWPLFGPTGRDDPAELAALKTSLSRFALSAPAVRLTSDPDGLQIALNRPVQVSPANGDRLTVSAAATPVFRSSTRPLGGGAFNLTTTRGRGLPEAAFAVPRWALTQDGFTADLNGRAALDFDLARGIELTTHGVLATRQGRVTYVAGDCTAVTVQRLELGENDTVDVAGNFCPVTAPLVSVSDGAWRASGRLADVSGAVPFLGARFSNAEGRLVANGGPRGLGLEAAITGVTIDDTMTPRRFNPLTASGTAALAGERWDGRFDLAVKDRPLGQLALTHDGPGETGGVTISVPGVTFAADGLQPADITPLGANVLQSPVVGTARFDGRLDWTPIGVTSSGVASTDGLDFTSPAGPVTGLKGSVAFTSLAPLTTAPGQTLTIDSVAAFASLTDTAMSFELRDGSARIEGGQFALAGGTVAIEPFDLPFDQTRSYSGVIVLERVQLGELIGASGFADKVAMNALVSGRLPFTSDANGVRIVGGVLAAVEPGRLAIQRSALTGLQAGGGGDVPPNTVQDLAYQAMENLSFEVLSADVNSLDEGRLGVVFHIKGRHDPPQRQELRMTLAEFISREFLNRELPLPSGTQIDLTLDTTLNINDLLSDVLTINRARNGSAEAEPEQ